MAQPPFVLYTGPASAETMAFAEKELRETPENIKKGLEELKELLKNDDTLFFCDDDEFLLIFLRPCKFFAESAYKLVRKHFFYNIKKQ